MTVRSEELHLNSEANICLVGGAYCGPVRLRLHTKRQALPSSCTWRSEML